MTSSDGQKPGLTETEGPTGSRRLTVLLLDYEMAREDERSMTNAITTTFSVLVALLGLLGAAIFTANKIDEPLLAAAPLLPLATLGYLQILSIQATMRSYYMRGLEREIQDYVKTPMTSLGELPPASYAGLVVEMASLRRGKVGFRVVANSLLIIIFTVFGGLTSFIAFNMHDRLLQALMALVYAPAAVLLIWESVTGTIGGRRLFERLARGYLRQDVPLPKAYGSLITSSARKGTSDRRERYLASYLLVPRPEDYVKWFVAPIVFMVAALSTGNWSRWSSFVAVWLILEYFIYSARYQWNDVRGIGEDAAHAEKSSRGRLPIGSNPKINIIASIFAIGLRLAAAVTIGHTLGQTIPVVALVGVVFGIAIVYEFLRARAPGSLSPNARMSPIVVAIWIVVSFGYAARASIGFTYGGLPLTGATTLVGLACIASYGALFVLLTWVLEATSYCRHDFREVNGRLSPGRRPLAWYRLDGLTARPHLLALLNSVKPDTLEQSQATEIREELIKPEHSDDYCGQHAILRTRGQVFTPWNVALWISATIGADLGILLSRGGGPSQYGLAALCGLVGAVMISLCSGTLARSLVITPVGVGLVVIAWIAQASSFVLAAVPWVIISVTYVGFRQSSYRDLKKLNEAVKDLREKCAGHLTKIPHLAVRLVLGRGTVEYLSHSSDGQENRQAPGPR